MVPSSGAEAGEVWHSSSAQYRTSSSIVRPQAARRPRGWSCRAGLARLISSAMASGDLVGVGQPSLPGRSPLAHERRTLSVSRVRVLGIADHDRGLSPKGVKVRRRLQRPSEPPGCRVGDSLGARPWRRWRAVARCAAAPWRLPLELAPHHTADLMLATRSQLGLLRRHRGRHSTCSCGLGFSDPAPRRHDLRAGSRWRQVYLMVMPNWPRSTVPELAIRDRRHPGHLPRGWRRAPEPLHPNACQRGAPALGRAGVHPIARCDHGLRGLRQMVSTVAHRPAAPPP